jgi:hypothetical protein
VGFIDKKAVINELYAALYAIIILKQRRHIIFTMLLTEVHSGFSCHKIIRITFGGDCTFVNELFQFLEIF